MISALKQFGLTRWLALLVFGSVLLGCMVGFNRGWSSDGYRVPGALDISGEWEFYNGKLTPAEAQTKVFPFKVQVPKPLPPEIREKLAEEFWYRKRFKLNPSRESSWAISFGAIKGEHEVYWSGRYLGSGGKTGIAVFRIPAEYLSRDEVTVSVRVKRIDTLFPGIVNLLSVVLGNANVIGKHETLYYSEQGVKPILSGLAKLIFSMLFFSLFIVTPQKREYLPFALFALFSAFGAAATSKFFPFYEEYYFKQSVLFLCTSLSIAMVPFVTSAFLRFGEVNRSYARGFGFAAALVFFLAVGLVKTKESSLFVYRFANEWLPLIVGVPSVVACGYCLMRLDRRLLHRRRQILIFGLSLLMGVGVWSGLATRFYSFQLVKYGEFVDALIFLGLAVALVLDFRAIANRSERAGKAVPKWFAGFLVTGTKAVQFEIAMVVIAVDTIGYTKKLAGVAGAEKDLLHAEIRDLLQHLTEVYGAQKLSDGGDGGLFAWDLPTGGKDGWKQLYSAANYIARVKGPKFGVQFRVGIAAGNVRCEMRGSDFSFMGEALNTAARLESMARHGEPLVDGELANKLDGLVSSEWTEADLKGVVYRGRTLKLVA
ncbi:MAG: hypothetical protein EOP06_07285 [Proteobacteria bacterium]|nr:MAG: hypothetical protein EOP06_07285 [Pseudomonadota bacterium]